MKCKEKKLLLRRIYFTAAVTVAVWAFILWEHFNGGVKTHHLLAKKDLPGISNWWGGLLIPALTWFLLYRIQKRFTPDAPLHADSASKNAVYGFCCALLFGAILSVCFSLGYQDLPGYMLLALLLSALFLPIYRAEHLLGFVIGMTFTFGTILPTLVGLVLTAVTAILYLFIRRGGLFVLSRLFRPPSKND